MECLHPIRLKDGRIVPCGNCPRCRRNRQRDWTFRLKAERDAAHFTLWLTLTIDEDHMKKFEGMNMLSREQPRHFFESLRHHYGKKLLLKHYLVSEYGDETDRPHFHCLLFCYLNQDHPNVRDILKAKEDLLKYITEDGIAWPYGFAYNKALHNHVFGYITNYVNKPELISDVPHPVRPFTCISQGIGISMIKNLDENRIKNDLSFIINYNGGKKALPRYYREKILPVSTASIRRAIERGDMVEANRMIANKQRLEQFLRNFIYPKKEREATIKMLDFEKDHSITYHEYREGCRSHELQEYKKQLKKRKTL